MKDQVPSWIVQGNPEKEKEFLQMILKESGFTATQVARIHNVSPAAVSLTVNRRRNSPILLRWFESVAKKLGYGYSYYMEYLYSSQDLVK
jgi:predicted transcriptional regulator